MRIGIIAMGRSGGYNLGRWIANETRYKYIHEPIINNLDITGNDIVVKWLVGELINQNTIPQMDKWIGLIREDIREQSVSQLRGSQTGEWHRPYKVSDEWISEREAELNVVMNEANEFKNKIQSDIPFIELQITYEGLYQTGEDVQKVCNYLDIQNPKYLEMFNPKRRLRNWENSNYKII